MEAKPVETWHEWETWEYPPEDDNGEPFWVVREVSLAHPWVARVFGKSRADRIIADHNAANDRDMLAAWAVEARNALMSDVRLQHLRNFPHVKPTDRETMLLDLLARYPGGEA